MAKEAAVREEARRQYVQDGLTLETIAEQLELARSTLTRWKQEGEWDKLRMKHRQQEEDIDAYVHKIKLRLARMLAENDEENPPDPQMIYALARGIAVLKPSAARELRDLDKAEQEANKLDPEERARKAIDQIEALYGVRLKAQGAGENG